MLDGVKYGDDRWSSVYAAETQSDIFFSGKEIGYGLGVRWNAGNDLRVAYVYPGSPAANAGLRRGWRITAVNGSPVTEELAKQISTSETGKSVTLRLVKLDGSETAQSLVSAKYDIKSVLYSEVVQTASKKVGYLALKSMLAPNETEIKDAISKMSNVQDLILDLRYCAGGHLDMMTATANMLAPTSASSSETEFYILLWEMNNSARGTGTGYIIKKSGGPNLNRIIVLTGSGTANLGEFLIAGLQPYMDVVLIGSKTDGTSAYGIQEWTLPDKKQKLNLVVSLFENSAGKNTLGGLAPAHSVADGLDRDWGDREESLLKAALKFAETGQTKSNLTRAAGQSQLPVVREYAPVKAPPLPKEVFSRCGHKITLKIKNKNMKLSFIKMAVLCLIARLSLSGCQKDEPDDKTVPVAGVSLNKTSHTLTVGETFALTADVTPNNATNKTLEWTSSSTEIASVADGTVTAVAAGEAVIIVSTENGKTAACIVKVVEIPVMTMTTTADTIKIALGSGTATVDWGDGTSETLAIEDVDPFDYMPWTSKAVHTYASSQSRTITITGTDITGFECWGNQLTALDVSKNTALTYLSCGSNQLTALDVSKNTALMQLFCDGNQLTALDVSKNTVLRELSCCGNNLSAVALNAMFGTLHSNLVSDKTVDICGNPGTAACDRGIARQKGWSGYICV
jgi:uncharacterized protein YjdB